MPKVELPSGKMVRYPYTRAGMAAAHKAAQKKGAKLKLMKKGSKNGK